MMQRNNKRRRFFQDLELLLWFLVGGVFVFCLMGLCFSSFFGKRYNPQSSQDEQESGENLILTSGPGPGVIYGLITDTYISQYEWGPEEGDIPDACRVNNNEYYLIAFGGETGTEKDGYLRTIQVWNDNGTLNTEWNSTFEFLDRDIYTSDVSKPSLCHIPGTDKYAVAYTDLATGGYCNVSVVQVWDNNGTINPSIVYTKNMSYAGNYPKIINVVGNVYAVLYSETATNDGFMETIWINDTGTINDTILSTCEFDTSYDYYNTGVMIDSDTIAIVYSFSGSDGNICTWNITNSGIIDSIKSDSWEFDDDYCTTPDIEHISGDIYAIAYINSTTGKNGVVKTLSIDSAGMISTDWTTSGSWVDTFQFANDSINNVGYPDIFPVNAGSVYGIVYSTYHINNKGNVSTVNISSSGVIGDAVIDNLNIGTTSSTYFLGYGGVPIYVNQSYYLIVYWGAGNDGWSRTIQILTNWAEPIQSSEYPVNESTGIALTPTCYITVNDTDADLMDITFAENTTGDWVIHQTNSSVSNGTIYWVFDEADTGDTTYWWRVYADDGLHNVSETYSFTTISLPKNYYVSNTGADSNNGTWTDTPWQNISKVKAEMDDEINIGDDVYFNRGDTFDDNYLDLEKGGTSSNWMIIGAYGTGDKPILTYDGGVSGYPPIYCNSELGYVIIENLNIKDNANNANGITFNDANFNNITIRNIDVSNMDNCGILIERTDGYSIENCIVSDIDNTGIAVYGSATNKITNGSIRNCTVYGVVANDGICIHDDGSSNDVGANHWIENCTAYECGEQGFDITSGENIYIENCEGYGNGDSSIVFGHDVRNVTVDNFYSHDENTSSDNDVGIYFTDSDNITIRNSILWNIYYSHIVIGDGTSPQNNITFIHNTLIWDGVIDGIKDGYFIRVGDNDSTRDIIFKNNIFYSRNYSDPGTFLYHSGDRNVTNTYSNYSHNMWWRGDDGAGDDTWWRDGSLGISLDLSEWQALSETEGEIRQNATFVDVANGDFTLQSSSPAIDAGVNLTITTDSGTGTSFTVDNANYFFDGYGLVEGDIIFVGSDSDLLVTEIDYDTNNITVNRSFTWVVNDEVGFSYNGSNPDIGAYESPYTTAGGIIVNITSGTNNWTVPIGVVKIDVLVIAGGGGSGICKTNTGRNGGGGGAGGLIWIQNVTMLGDIDVKSGNIISYSVGAGGAGSTSSTSKGETGGNTVFGNLTAIGGGGGGSPDNRDGANGGSGGGGGTYVSYGSGGTGNQSTQEGWSGIYGYGYDGAGGAYHAAGGGGGAGGAASGTTGGVGLNMIDYFGTSYGYNGWFSSGGGGNDTGSDALNNTGMGGRAHIVGDYSNGRDGGSGIILLRLYYSDSDVYISSPDPANHSTMIDLQPTVTINVNETNGNLMDVTFASNYTGSWVNYQTNTSVNNGTYYWKFNGVTGYNTTYYWRVYCNNSLTNISETYWFVSWYNTPPFSFNIDIANQSTSIPVDIFVWSANISDIDGHNTNGTIVCSNGNSTSWSEQPNGTKELLLGTLSYLTNYTIWLNYTDGYSNVNESFWFITESQPISTSVDPISPYNITTTPLTINASNTGCPVNNITLYYRYQEEELPMFNFNPSDEYDEIYMTSPSLNLGEINIEDKIFTTIDSDEYLLLGGYGDPPTVSYVLNILLRNNQRPSSIEITRGEPMMIKLEYPLLPNQPEIPLSSTESPVFMMNKDSYSSNALVSDGAGIVYGVEYMRGYPIQIIGINLTDYNPSNNILYVYNNIKIKIYYNDETIFSKPNKYLRNNNNDKSIVQDFVINPSTMDTYGDFMTFDDEMPLADLYPGGLCTSGTVYEYVIVTNSSINGSLSYTYNWSDLIIHRELVNGFNATIVLINDINNCSAYWNTTNATFNDSATQLREFCKDAYLDWNTEYILLGGDWTDDIPSEQIIPYRTFTTPSLTDYEYNYMPSDLYFSNLDGTFWRNDIGCWGGDNTTGLDKISELYIGRIAAYNASMVSNAVQHILWYDNYTNNTWLSSSCFIGAYLGWTSTSKQYMEELRVGDGSYSEYTGFEEFNTSHPDYNMNTSYRYYHADLGNEWDDRFGENLTNFSIVNHCGHSNYDSPLSLYGWYNVHRNTSFFSWSQGCLAGRFTLGYWGSGCEQMICKYTDSPSFALVLNTGYGWGSVSSTHGQGQLMQKIFWHYFFDDVADSPVEWQLGKAHTYQKDTYAPMTISLASTYSWYSSTLFGDPAQRLKFNDTIPMESTWGDWTIWSNASNPDSSSPYSWGFDFPDGYGYYEFYSIGANNSVYESSKSSAEAECHYIEGETRVVTEVFDYYFNSGGNVTIRANTTIFNYYFNNGGNSTTRVNTTIFDYYFNDGGNITVPATITITNEYPSNNTGNFSIPSLVYNNLTGSTSTRLPNQRKRFYADNRFWVFYSNYITYDPWAEMYYTSSSDGTTWETPTLVQTIYLSSAYATTYFDGTYVYFAARNVVTSGTWMDYRKGIPYGSNGTIDWIINESHNTTRLFSDPIIAVNSTGAVFVGTNSRIDPTGYGPGISIRNETGVWTDSLLNDTLYRYFTSPLPLTDGEIYAVYFYGYTSGTSTIYPFYGKHWDGNSWGSQEVVTTLGIDTWYYSRMDATSIDDIIHLVFLENIGKNITYVKYTGSTWGSPVVLYNGSNSSSPTISIDKQTGDLYVFWSSNPSNTSIYYMKYDNITSTWDSTPNLVYNETNGLSSSATVASSSEAESNYISVTYSANYSNPHFVKHFYFNLNTTDITPLCSIDINNSQGHSMTVSWYENTTGSWILRQTNSSCSNGTYAWNYSQATGYDTAYWWRVYVDDGISNISETYSFTTIAAAAEENRSVTQIFDYYFNSGGNATSRVNTTIFDYYFNDGGNVTATNNSIPTIEAEYPVNGSTCIDTTPICYLTVNDSNGDTMNITWWTNATSNIFNNNHSSIIIKTVGDEYACTRMPIQHNIWYANGRFWAFFVNGTGHERVYSSSIDGTIWDTPTYIRDGHGGAEMSVWVDDNTIHYVFAYGSGYPPRYRMGTLNNNGTITWTADEQIINEWQACWDVTICTDTNGYPWVTWINTSDYYPVVCKSSTKDGTWTTASGFPYELNNSRIDMLPIVVPLTNGQVYVVYGYSYNGGTSDYIYGKLWNGTGWGSQEKASTTLVTNDFFGKFSVVSIGDTVHVAFTNTSGDLIHIYRNNITKTWSSEVLIESINNISVAFRTKVMPILCKTQNDDLMAFWLNYNSTTLGYYAYYSRWSHINNTWYNKTRWFQDNDIYFADALAFSTHDCFYNEINGKIGLIYRNNTGSVTYRVVFNYLDMGRSWIRFGENLSIVNSIFYQNGYLFNQTNTTYWWSVNATDGVNWCNETYNFTTVAAADENRAVTQIFDYYFNNGGNASHRDNVTIFDYYFSNGGNYTSRTNTTIFDYYFNNGGNATGRVNTTIFDYFFSNGGNTTTRTNITIFDYYFNNGGNGTTRVNTTIFDYYFSDGGNTSETATPPTVSPGGSGNPGKKPTVEKPTGTNEEPSNKRTIPVLNVIPSITIIILSLLIIIKKLNKSGRRKKNL